MMSTGEIIACVSLGIGLLAYAWRAGGVSSTIGEAVKTLNDKAARLEKKAELADEVPELRRRLAQLETTASNTTEAMNRSIRPMLVRVEEHVKAVDQRVSSIKAMQAVRPPYRSKPDLDE